MSVSTDPSTAAPRSDQRVLIVDDHRDGAEALALLLELHGYQPTVVADGQQALAAAERLRPGIAVLDLRMPPPDGFSLCQALRAEPWGQTMRLYALSGSDQAADRRRATEAGFDGYLLKGETPTLILECLKCHQAVSMAGPAETMTSV